MTIGDVMAVVGSVLGICLSLWVLLIGSALLFEERMRVVQGIWQEQPQRALGYGVLLVLTLGVLSIALLNAPGGFKLLGWLLLAGLLATSVFGGGGLALLLGERTGVMAPQLSPLGALSRGAAMLSLAWLFPILGWFLIAPVSIMMGLGAGAMVLFPRKRREAQSAVLALEEPCESHGVTG